MREERRELLPDDAVEHRVMRPAGNGFGSRNELLGWPAYTLSHATSQVSAGPGRML